LKAPIPANRSINTNRALRGPWRNIMTGEAKSLGGAMPAWGSCWAERLPVRALRCRCVRRAERSRARSARSTPASGTQRDATRPAGRIEAGSRRRSLSSRRAEGVSQPEAAALAPEAAFERLNLIAGSRAFPLQPLPRQADHYPILIRFMP
jgi:hypothetical protein